MSLLQVRDLTKKIRSKTIVDQVTIMAGDEITTDQLHILHGNGESI